jgi:hypothetical protein
MKWRVTLNTNATVTISDNFCIGLEVLLPFIKNEAKDTRWRPFYKPATQTNTAAASSCYALFQASTAA